VKTQEICRLDLDLAKNLTCSFVTNRKVIYYNMSLMNICECHSKWLKVGYVKRENIITYFLGKG
jgi:hypothetical protein